MTNRQYEQLLANRGRRWARALFPGLAEAKLLQAAARNLRRRAAAEQVLERVLPSDVLGATSIEALDQGTLTVSVSGSLGGAQRRHAVAQLRKQLVGTVPGVRKVRVAPLASGEARRARQEIGERKRGHGAR